MTHERSAGRSRSAIGWSAAILIVVLVLEAFSFVAVSAVRRQWFTYGRLQAARAAIATGSESPIAAGNQVPAQPGFFVQEVVHPYLGFVLDRTYTRCRPDLAGFRDVMDYGFYCSDVPLLQHRESDKVIVGIFGGSVAYAFPALGVGPLRDELGRSPLFAGRRIVIVPLALPGYKQPQQLMTLAYFLMLGGQFDYVVNLDGFNDIVLPAVENVPKGVFGLFPRSWFFRVGALDPTTRAEMGEVAYIRSRRASRARTFSRAPLRWTITGSLVWTLLDRLAIIEDTAVQSRLLKQHGVAGSFVQTGPERGYASEAEMYADLAAAWQRSSLQMHRLTQANGGVYLHFLQPNQYVPDSKPMGDEERSRALSDSFGFRHSVVMGYPVLQKLGLELLRDGVRFHDMTQVFAHESRPVYVDACCHFDATGYEALGRAMARAIVDDAGNSGRPAPGPRTTRR